MKIIFHTALFLTLAFSLSAQNVSKESRSISVGINQGLILYTDNDVSVNITNAKLKLNFCDLNPKLCPLFAVN